MSKIIYKSDNMEYSLEDILKFNDDKLLYIDNFNFVNMLSGHEDILVYSESMLEIFNKISKIKKFPDIPVLIQGETGTGKEVLSSFLASETSNKKFVGINCSNLSKELFESELFGYEKGAFTGAASGGKNGKLHEAKGGILFMDEFTEIPLDMQSKLLRVLQEREYYKVGGNTPEKVESRFLFAANKNVKELVKTGLFREDLYYRINICEITIPPLRKRQSEIIPLIVNFTKKISDEFNKKIDSIEAGILKKAYSYNFPGNIRELKNMVTKLFLFEESNTLKTEDIYFDSSEYLKEYENSLINLNNIDFSLPDKPFNLEEFEEKIVRLVLKKFNGNKTKTASFLGLNRIQMYGKYKNIETRTERQ